MSDFDPVMMPRCKNCGEALDEHIEEADQPWMCKPTGYETHYGYFCGGDPRTFHPDYESCTPTEIANHKAACELAEKLESERSLPCPSGWEQWGDAVVHILRAPFGIGVTVNPPTYYEVEETHENQP